MASRVSLPSTVLVSISVVVVLKVASGVEIFHVTLGAGTPLTVHVKTTTSWSTAVKLLGSSSIVEATEGGGERGGGREGGSGREGGERGEGKGGGGQRGRGERGGRGTEGEGGERGGCISIHRRKLGCTCYSSHVATADTHQLVQLLLWCCLSC